MSIRPCLKNICFHFLLEGCRFWWVGSLFLHVYMCKKSFKKTSKRFLIIFLVNFLSEDREFRGWAEMKSKIHDFKM